ncbi:MAG: Ig-like domain-containing protein [Treponemataceae bacterium]|nr:Ig-like domain-containing protein [Treponemataceae bacterium]
MTTEKAQVRASVPAARITVDERLIEMQIGETRELKATVLPLLASSTNKLTPSEIQNAALLSMLVTDKIEWISSDAEIVSVDEGGIITALKEGTVKISAKSGEHEIICNILVNVPIPEWASEEFLEYIERIGAYTELPLGTDGSAGPTAQYVTFGFELSYDDFRCFNEIDERTKTTYKEYDYTKAYDDEWYWKWGYTCNDTSHDHSQSTMESYTNNRGETVTPAPAAYKITPRKWRLLDREKGLMVMEDYDSYMNIGIRYFSVFSYMPYENDHYYAYYNKNVIEKMPAIFNYETSHLRAWLDGGEYLEYFDFFEAYNNGNFKTDGNGKYIYDHTEVRMFRMNERRIWTDDYGRHRDYAPYTNKGNHFQNFFAPSQLAQIKEVDLDCGEGGSVKGRLFILSEDEIRKYYSDGSKFNWYYTGETCLTRTRKKIDGKNTLCAVKINYDGTVKEFVQLEGYDTGDYNYIIPAICVAPAPQE